MREESDEDGPAAAVSEAEVVVGVGGWGGFFLDLVAGEEDGGVEGKEAVGYGFGTGGVGEVVGGGRFDGPEIDGSRRGEEVGVDLGADFLGEFEEGERLFLWSVIDGTRRLEEAGAKESIENGTDVLSWFQFIKFGL